MPLRDESSQTGSSSDGGIKFPYFERSQKIVPHAIVHFADQVIKGGTHAFHDSKANEANHKLSIAFVGERSRTYVDENTSATNMLSFTMAYQRMEKIVELTGV